MDEISQLNEDLYQLEYAKNKQIESIKERYTKQHKGQLQTILTNHAQTIELLQLEISKLKDVNHAKDQSIEAI